MPAQPRREPGMTHGSLRIPGAIGRAREAAADIGAALRAAFA